MLAYRDSKIGKIYCAYSINFECLHVKFLHNITTLTRLNIFTAHPITATPTLSITINDSAYSTMLHCSTLITGNPDIPIEQISWFLGQVGTPTQVGSAWTLDTGKLSPGKHTIMPTSWI